MVPNHMGIDSEWVIEHPERFIQLAEPPYPALYFTPFQFQGLWLEVIITPPVAPKFTTAYESAGVGV